jgi:hypothetical protein
MENTNTFGKHNIEKVYFTKEQIEEHKTLICLEYANIRKLEQQMLHHKKQIEKYQNMLIVNCNHNRVADRACMYDKTTYHCDICNQDLWDF